MRRRILTLASAFSLLLCAMVAMLWLTSYWIEIRIGWNGKNVNPSFRFSRGEILLRVDLIFDPDQPPVRPGLYHELWQTTDLAAYGSSYGFRYLYFASMPRYPSPRNLEVSRRLLLPCWFVFVGFLLLPARVWLLRKAWQRQRWSEFNGCPQCGYNLTGNTSGVCPECGAAIKSKGIPIKIG